MRYAKWIHGSEDIAEAKQVRQAVFVEEQGYTPEQEFDATDALSWHVVALDEETPVGTGRLYVQDGQYCIGRLCVLPEYRGQGIGEAMVGLLIDRAMMIGAPGLHVYCLLYTSIQGNVMQHHLVVRIAEGQVEKAYIAFQFGVGDGAVRLVRMPPGPQDVYKRQVHCSFYARLPP